MEDGPPMFGQGFTCPALLVFTPRRVSRTGLSPCAAGLSSPFRYPPRRLRAFPLSLAATRGISVDFFSSGYLDVSVPPVRLPPLWIHGGMPAKGRRVSPFGHRRVTGRLPPRRRFSQAAAPFFASHRLGIHRMRLFAWPYNPNRPKAAGAHAPPSHPARARHHCLFSTMRAPGRLYTSLDLTLLLYFASLSRAHAEPQGRLPPAPGRGADACVSQFVKECAAKGMDSRQWPAAG